ncbi:MAG: hypothetical protein AB202_02090 [Parcubacteria bacterium C7867-007]|nr:MAG: hypothetical protein AB202_02090 [Parcubacteria bacterium C7867-007]
MQLITAEMHERLSGLMSSRHILGPPPKRLLERQPNSVLIGVATTEQKAIAILYDQVKTEHEGMHEANDMPMGINPYVNFAHFRNHVMTPILFEMLKWSVHRAYPEQTTNLAIRFDDKWNMYGVPKALADPAP